MGLFKYYVAPLGGHLPSEQSGCWSTCGVLQAMFAYETGTKLSDSVN